MTWFSDTGWIKPCKTLSAIEEIYINNVSSIKLAFWYTVTSFKRMRIKTVTEVNRTNIYTCRCQSQISTKLILFAKCYNVCKAQFTIIFKVGFSKISPKIFKIHRHLRFTLFSLFMKSQGPIIPVVPFEFINKTNKKRWKFQIAINMSCLYEIRTLSCLIFIWNIIFLIRITWAK